MLSSGSHFIPASEPQGVDFISGLNTVTGARLALTVIVSGHKIDENTHSNYFQGRAKDSTEVQSLRGKKKDGCLNSFSTMVAPRARGQIETSSPAELQSLGRRSCRPLEDKALEGKKGCVLTAPRLRWGWPCSSAVGRDVHAKD